MTMYTVRTTNRLASNFDSNRRAIHGKVKILASAVIAASAKTTVNNDSRIPHRKAAARMAKMKYRKKGLLGPFVKRLISVGHSKSVACTNQENRNSPVPIRNQSVAISARQ